LRIEVPVPALVASLEECLDKFVPCVFFTRFIPLKFTFVLQSQIHSSRAAWR
jgi:hypothetical protein